MQLKNSNNTKIYASNQFSVLLYYLTKPEAQNSLMDLFRPSPRAKNEKWHFSHQPSHSPPHAALRRQTVTPVLVPIPIPAAWDISRTLHRWIALAHTVCKQSYRDSWELSKRRLYFWLNYSSVLRHAVWTHFAASSSIRIRNHWWYFLTLHSDV